MLNREFKAGKVVEQQFVSTLKAYGLSSRPSSKTEDMYSHIDGYFVDSLGQTYSYDVKARKKLSRASKDQQDDYTFIEFSNVRGNPGWLYGKADLIVFERELDYLLILREELVTRAEELVDFTKQVDQVSDCDYCIYTRKGRMDRISRIKLSDIIDLATVLEK